MSVWTVKQGRNPRKGFSNIWDSFTDFYSSKSIIFCFISFFIYDYYFQIRSKRWNNLLPSFSHTVYSIPVFSSFGRWDFYFYFFYKPIYRQFLRLNWPADQMWKPQTGYKGLQRLERDHFFLPFATSNLPKPYQFTKFYSNSVPSDLSNTFALNTISAQMLGFWFF